MTHYFISYTVRDGSITKEILKSIKKYYGQFGTSFIDMLDNESKEKQIRVYEELEKADIFILIKTPGISQSNWVQEEIRKAKQYKIPINEIVLSDLEKHLLHYI